MRRVRSDVSHRIRRQPSIFSVRWFRIALGVGFVLVLALLVGPSVAGWFGGDLPRSVFLLVPWSTAEKTAASRPPSEPAPPPVSRPSVTSPGPASAPAQRPATVVTPKALAPDLDGQAGASERAPAAPPASAAAPRAASPPAPSAGNGTAAAATLTTPPAVYWVQVGAFLDHRNADRLVERLRGDGLSAATTSFEQSRVLYRVLLVGADGGRISDDTLERVRGLGHAVETTPDGPAVTGLVPLRRAVEMSHTLRQQGVPVRLKQEVSSATFRVVRVGAFPTVAEADAALAALAARGVEGVVMRER